MLHERLTFWLVFLLPLGAVPINFGRQKNPEQDSAAVVVSASETSPPFSLLELQSEAAGVLTRRGHRKPIIPISAMVCS